VQLHAPQRIIGNRMAVTTAPRINPRASAVVHENTLGFDHEAGGDVADALRPGLVERNRRRPATGLPAGSIGEEAFADPGAWVGFIKLPAGATSGWHHHGAWDSYAVVLGGVLRWEYGEGGGQAIEVRAGDTGRMPAHMVHRDVSAGDEPLDMILFRAGEGELTVNVDGPDGAPDDGGREPS
jgi:uncharacterized RmlC-like cupin family protein